MALAETFGIVWACDETQNKEASFKLLQHITISQRNFRHGLFISFNDGSIGKLDVFNNIYEVLI